MTFSSAVGLLFDHGAALNHFTPLRDVVVLVGVLLVPLHVVPVDERLYPLFEVGRLDGELELLVQLVDEEGVREGLAHLHDADDGGVNLVLAVLEHALLGSLLLVLSLLQLDLEIWGENDI